MSRSVHRTLGFLLALGLGTAALAGLLRGRFGPDYGQCARRCHALVGDNAAAVRPFFSSNTCVCTTPDGHRTSVGRSNDGSGPIPAGAVVCTKSGQTYAALAAIPETDTPLHGGPCGACSNVADIEIYRRTRRTLTGIAEACARRRILLGEDAARACFAERSKLSPPCVRCWVDNLGCTAAHCLAPCLWAKLTSAPPNLADGSLNSCLACDEQFCGGPFIRCAGANRRRAGIDSDIRRPDEQKWQPPR